MCFSHLLDGYPNLKPNSDSAGWRRTRHFYSHTSHTLYIQSKINAFRWELTGGWDTSKICALLDGKGHIQLWEWKCIHDTPFQHALKKVWKQFLLQICQSDRWTDSNWLHLYSFVHCLFWGQVVSERCFYTWQHVKVCDVTAKRFSLWLAQLFITLTVKIHILAHSSRDSAIHA